MIKEILGNISIWHLVIFLGISMVVIFIIWLMKDNAERGFRIVEDTPDVKIKISVKKKNNPSETNIRSKEDKEHNSVISEYFSEKEITVILSDYVKEILRKSRKDITRLLLKLILDE